MDNTRAEDEVVSKRNVLFEVTTLSKTLAVVLFIILPFVGFLIGYNYKSSEQINLPTSNIQIEDNDHGTTPNDSEVTKKLDQKNVQVSLINIQQERFAPGQDRIPGTGDMREFEVLSVNSDRGNHVISHERGEPLLLWRDYGVSPSGDYIYVISQKYIDDTELAVYVYDVNSKILHNVELAEKISDDEHVHPEDILNIKWLADNKLYIEPQTIEIGIISTSSETPWIVQADI